MSRPYDWSPLGRGSDPVPGDPGTVATTAMKYRATAQAVSEASSNLSHLDMSENKSLGLSTVLDQIKAVRKQLDDVESRVDGAAAALESYGPKLGEAQRLSLEALSAAEFAKQAAQSSQARRDEAASDYYATNDPAQRSVAKDRYNAYNSRVASANQDLALAKAKLQQAIALRDEAAGTATNALRSIDQSSPVRDTAMDHIQEFLNKLVDFWDKNIAPHLATICKILDVISLVLTVVAVILMITGVGAPVGAALLGISKALKVVAVISVGIAVAKLTISGLKTLTGRQSPGELIKDAGVLGLGLALSALGKFGVGKAVGRAFAYSTLKLDRLSNAAGAASKLANLAVGRVKHLVTDLTRDALGHDPSTRGPSSWSKINSYRVQTCGATT